MCQNANKHTADALRYSIPHFVKSYYQDKADSIVVDRATAKSGALAEMYGGLRPYQEKLLRRFSEYEQLTSRLKRLGQNKKGENKMKGSITYATEKEVKNEENTPFVSSVTRYLEEVKRLEDKKKEELQGVHDFIFNKDGAFKFQKKHFSSENRGFEIEHDGEGNIYVNEHLCKINSDSLVEVFDKIALRIEESYTGELQWIKGRLDTKESTDRLLAEDHGRLALAKNSLEEDLRKVRKELDYANFVIHQKRDEESRNEMRLEKALVQETTTFKACLILAAISAASLVTNFIQWTN